MTHGTRVMYVIGKCRCDECREGNRIAQADSERRKREGRSLFVPAEPVRQRVRKLYELGMTENEVERAANLDDKVLEAMFRKHWRTGKPVQRMKRENAERIMAIRKRSLLPGNYGHFLDFRGMALDLMALGHTAPWICQQLGLSYQGRAVLLSPNHTVQTYARMRRLHGATVDRATNSPEASRSRNFAIRERSKSAPKTRRARVA